MSRVFVSAATGAVIYVFADDHRPPHVHARHRGDGWVARVRFSYANSDMQLVSIAPLRGVPLQRVMSALLDDIQARLVDCRRRWWAMRRTTCLVNQWAVVPTAGYVELSLVRAPNAKQIAEARYDPESGTLYLAFRDGSTTEVSMPP